MRGWKVFILLFLLFSVAFASESHLPFSTVFKGQDQFNRLVAKAKAGELESVADWGTDRGGRTGLGWDTL